MSDTEIGSVREFPYAAVGNTVIVKPIDPPDKTAGGIALVGKNVGSTRWGTVVAVGQGRFLECGEVEVPNFECTEVVAYHERAGTPLNIPSGEGAGDYVVLHAPEVLAVRIDEEDVADL